MTTLVTVRAGLTLTPGAAASWVRMETELGRQLDVNRSYASWDVQYRYWVDWTTFSANPRAWRAANPGKPDPPLALHPSQSWHCLGLAVDTDDDRVVRAMPAYGWRFVVLSERWHAQYYAHLDRYRGQRPAGGTSKPLPTPTQKDDSMELITYKTAAGDRVYLRLDVSEAYRETKAEAVAWNAARGGIRHTPLTLSQAHTVLESIRRARAQRVGEVADAVTRQIDQLLDEIGEVDQESIPDDDA